MNKVLSTIVLLIVCAVSAMAQLTVTDFYYAPTDATANTRNTEEYDQNGDRCALIKVETTQRDFSFDVGTMGVTKVLYQPGEIWVYVPKAVNHITIKHPRLGVLRDYNFNKVSIRSGCTYIMKLSTGSVETIVHHAVNQQYLIFHVTPENAMVEVIHDGEEKMWPINDGVARECVPFGKYQYRISAEDYHTEAGTIEIKDAEKAQEIAVNLQPNFGWLRIDATEDLQGALVYIDKKQCGTIPFVSERIKSGEHSLSIVKKMYNNYNQLITIKDNDTLTLSPTLEANFVEVELRALDNAEIWVNNEKYGVGSWSGRLEARGYFVETKLPSHRTRDTVINLTREWRHQTFILPKPSPIYGSLQVETLPNGASVYLNGVQKGWTPKLINHVLVGTYTVRVSKENYADYVATVTVEEGKIAKVEGELGHAQQVSISTNADVNWVLDGEDLGKRRALARNLTYGVHTLELSGEGYKTVSKTFEVTPGGSSNFSYTVARAYDFPWYDGGRGMETFVLGEFSYSILPQMAYGLMIGQTYRGSGWYVQGRSNFKFCGKRYDEGNQIAGMELVCGEDGKIKGELPYYSGKKCSSEWMVTAGFVGDILDWAHVPNNRFHTFGFYIGGGYGSRQLYWETNYNYEGKAILVKYAPTSYKGFAGDFGLIGSVYGLTLKAGVSTINFQYMEIEVGLGWMF